MNNNTQNAVDPAEIEVLLPWYVTGKLDAADMARVEAFLDAHPDMRRQIDLVREEQTQSTAANEALGYPSAGSLDRIMAVVGHDAGDWARTGSLRTWLSEFFAAPSPQGVRWAAAAAGLLLLLQAAVIGALIVGRSADPYQTAGGEQVIAGPGALIVGFADKATMPAISALLGEVGAQIADGPKPGNLYGVRLTKSNATSAEREEVARRLRARPDVVKVVLIAKE